MDWVWFLFSLKGRLNRAGLWFALLVILCWMAFCSALVRVGGKLFGGPTSFDFDLNDIFAAVDPETYRGLSQADLVPSIIHVLGTPVFSWAFIATGVKRLHDRGRNGWWMLPFFVIPSLANQFADRLGDSFALVAGTATALLYFCGFIELYCLAGEHWTNRYGPGPLLKAQTRARSVRAASPAGTAGDQQSELDVVPHIGAAPGRGARPAVQKLTSLFR